VDSAVAAAASEAAAPPGVGEMNWSRLLRHALTSNWSIRRRLPAAALKAVEEEITAGEQRHGGELRVVIETRLDAPAIWNGQTPRERALEVFALQRVWDTELDNGVLIYVLVADHDVEIVADRGFNGRVTGTQWEEVCRTMEKGFRAGQYREALLAGVRAASERIAHHFPPGAVPRNELPDAPTVL